MYLKKLEKSLIKPNMQSLIKRKVYSQRKSFYEFGYLYTCFRDLDEKLFLGFTKNIDLVKEDLFSQKFLVMGKRQGNKNELKLLKRTLFELGHLQSNKSNYYNCNQSILKHLSLLAWPIGELSNNFYSKKMNN